MITVLIAGILGFLISLTALPVFIKKMKSLKLGQLIRDEGPAAHQYKAGTPTMAGLIFIPAAILAYLLTMGISAVFFGTSPLPSATAWLTIAFTLGMLGVGAADDIMKFRHKGNEGLTERQKTIGLLAVTVPFAFLAFQFPNESGARPASTAISFVRDLPVDLFAAGAVFGSILVAVWITLISLSGTNAVNFTDGLDGLANGVSAISATTVLVIALIGGQFQVAVVMAALVGACVGFMPYNMNPAKMFMGDTGATFLGYILATMSIQGLFKFYAIISFAVPFLILGLPIFDTAFAFIRRIAHGQSPMHADRSHIHHRLIDMGLNQKQAVATLYVISAILGLSAVVLTTSGEGRAMLLFLVLCIVAVVAARVVFPKEVKEELHEELEELKEHGHHGHHPADKPEDDGKTEEK